jgi:glycosyltransferase involved in cell wall biosynthesis
LAGARAENGKVEAIPERRKQHVPKVSVILPTYRRPALFARALESVLLQDEKDFEVVIVDDNGRGTLIQRETEALLKQNYPDPRIRYIVNETGQGGSGARNIGIQESEGEYIAFLDDDDNWLPGKLKAQAELLDSCDVEVGVIHSGFYLVNAKGHRAYKPPQMQGWILEDLIAKDSITKRAPKLSTMLCRRTVVLQSGLFDTRFRSRQDLDFYVRLSKLCRFESIDQPLAEKRIDAEERISTNVASKIQGYECFYAEHYDLIKKSPSVHADYLVRSAVFYIKGGKYSQALRNWWQACFLAGFNPSKIVLYAKRVLGPQLKKR